MAVTDPACVKDANERLFELLNRAKSLKSQKSIDPPLPSSDFTGDLGLPPNDISKISHFSAVEIAAKRIFQEHIARYDIIDGDFSFIWNLLDVLQILGDQEQCEPVLLWYLIEELLESQSIEGCRIVFDYLESRRERLVAKNFQKVQLVILRACNELLRRLSRAEDAVFCGRVFIFVFQSFPLGDRSSINRQGDYNVTNVTAFDEPSAPSKVDVPANDDTTMMDAEDIVSSSKLTEDGVDPSKIDITTDQLYATFWGLQQSFAYPPRVFNSKLLEEFKSGFAATLSKFNKMPKVVSTNIVDSRRNPKRKTGEVEPEDFANNFSPKYLTSRELFELELSDLAFQRHILVQGIILLDFLLSFTEKAKKTPASRAPPKVSFTLSDGDTEWAVQTKKAIVASLREAPDGPAFARVVETVLSRDKNWVRWKEENCPEISRLPVTAETYSSAADGARALCAPKKLRATPLRSLDLKFLEESEHTRGVDALSDPTRSTLPNLATLVEDVAKTELDLDFASTGDETEQLQQLKAAHTWRALRIGSRSALNKFSQLNSDKQLKRLIDDGGAEHGPQATSDDVQDGDGADGEGPNGASDEGLKASDNPSESSAQVPKESMVTET